MKTTPLQYFFKKLVIWILLIQMINLSMDPVDTMNFKDGRATIEEDLSINEIESLYELISEALFGEDVPEHDEKDEDAFVKVFSLYYAATPVELVPVATFTFSIDYTAFYQDRSCLNYAEPHFPPPEQA